MEMILQTVPPERRGSGDRGPGWGGHRQKNHEGKWSECTKASPAPEVPDRARERVGGGSVGRGAGRWMRRHNTPCLAVKVSTEGQCGRGGAIGGVFAQRQLLR
uniref:Uncharacterized protein n=1 Tax=Eutreptiella gymnastica TaxID=73025 RepID=A0A7S4LD56_9EUGL